MTSSIQSYPQAHRPHSSAISADWSDRDHVVALLDDQLEAVARAFLGEPNRASRTKRQWRWGAKGSVSLDVAGPNRGRFADFEAGIHGGVIDLIMSARGCGFAAALDHARAFLGISEHREPDAAEIRIIAERRAQQAARTAAAEIEDEGRAEHARALWQAAQPIEAGSIGDTYLQGTRAIPAPAEGWPSDLIRFDPRRRAIVVPLTQATGTLTAVQLIHLAADGRKATQADLDRLEAPAGKVTRGVLAGTAWRLPAGDMAAPVTAGMVAVAEGPETALAVWTATGCRTWATIGTIKSDMSVLPGAHVLICRDDDPLRMKNGQPSQSLAASRYAATAWNRAGHVVTVVYPWIERRHDKSDLADTIAAGGVEAVMARFRAALAPEHDGPRGIPVADVRSQGAALIREFVREAIAWTIRKAGAEPGAEIEAAPARFLGMDVGTGKSHAARVSVVDWLASRPTASASDAAIVFTVPRHDLADEAAGQLRRMIAARGLTATVAVWRGRDAADPDQGKRRMCHQPEDMIAAAVDAGVSIEEKICTGCPFRDACGYQKQRKVSAIVWITAHHLLFSQRPKAIGSPVAVIVDEGFVDVGLFGLSRRPRGIPLTALLARSVPGLENAAPTTRSRIIFGRSALEDSADANGFGPLRRDALSENLTDPKTALEMAGLEQWRADALLPDMDVLLDPVRRDAEAGRMAECRSAGRMAALWRAVADLADQEDAEGSGRIELVDTDAGPALVLRGRRNIHRSWSAPTLNLDATGSRELAAAYLPGITTIGDLHATMPHQHVRQIVGKSWSSSSWKTAGIVSPERVTELRVEIDRQMRKTGARTALVVMQKALREAVEKAGPIAGVDFAHFGDLAGRDCWGSVDLVMVVGRSAPPPLDMERTAEALTGRSVERLADKTWYVRQDVAIRLRDGSTQSLPGDRHPDPIVERLRWRAAEGEIIQAIGRGRGVNRTAANPLHVVILGDTPLPELDIEAIEHREQATPAERMAAAGGVVLETPRHAATAYPAIWPSQKAAERPWSGTGQHPQSVPRFPTSPY